MVIKPIPGTLDYAARSDGALIRLTPGRGTWVGRIFFGTKRKDRYLQVWIPGYNLAHQAIATAFLGPCPSSKEVNHKDNIRANNRYKNLEYLTRRENVVHGATFHDPKIKAKASRRNLLKALAKNRKMHYSVQRNYARTRTGEKNPHSILTWRAVTIIRRVKPYPGYRKALAIKFGVHEGAIGNVLRGSSWNK